MIGIKWKGIGKDVYSSLENGIYQPYFSIVAKNARESQREEFISVIEQVLADVVKKGLDKKALAAAINYFEFKYRILPQRIDAGTAVAGQLAV